MDYSKLKVVDLKAELKKRGLPQSGLKQELVDRLSEADAEAAASEQADGPAATESAPDAAGGTTGDVEEEKAEEKALPNEEAIIPTDVAEPADVTANGDRGVNEGGITEEQPSNGHTEQGEELDVPALAALPTTESKEDAPMVVQPASFDGTKDEVKEEVAEEKQDSTPLEDSIDDTRKRKRRSPTPDQSSAEAQKKLKQNGVHVELSEDNVRGPPKDTETSAEQTMDVDRDMEAKVDSGIPVAEGSATKVIAQPGGMDTEPSGLSEHMNDGTPVKAEPTSPDGTPSKSQRDARYRSLFPSATADAPMDRTSPPPEDTDAEVPAAVHPATPSLYIRNFMRPLQPSTLRSHLLSLATPPNYSADEDPDALLKTFFLDQIRTHCLCTFDSVSTASRVRNAIHGRVWPDERTRKPLWADFIPRDKVEEWIEIEQSSNSGASRSSSKRWEVVYEPLEDEDGPTKAVEAVLREVDPRSLAPPSGPRGSTSEVPPPSGPRSSFLDSRRDIPPSRGAPTDLISSANTSSLPKTFAKPSITYAPVSRELAKQRLEALDRLTSRKFKEATMADEFVRFTFEDGDRLVRGAPDPYPFGRAAGYRGPPRGGRGGRGDYRGRRDFGPRGTRGGFRREPSYERGLPPPPPGRSYDYYDDAPPRRPSYDDAPPRDRARKSSYDDGPLGGDYGGGFGGRGRGRGGRGGYRSGGGVGFGREDARPRLDEEWPRDRGGWAR